MNINLITKITLFSLTTSITALATATSAAAFSFSLSGTFDDGGTIGGTFELYEPTLPGRDYQCSNIDLTTTGGSVVTTGTNYNDRTPPVALVQTCSNNGFSLYVYDDVNDEEYLIDIVSESSLSALTPTETVQLSNSTTEEYFGTVEPYLYRNLEFGTVTAAVPFEFSPTLGLLLVGGVWGINHLRKSRKKIE